MPSEAHLDAVRDAAGVRPDPRLVPVEDDPDLARPVTGLGAGRLAVVKVPPVAGNERAAVADPVANRLEVPRPSPAFAAGFASRSDAGTPKRTDATGVLPIRAALSARRLELDACRVGEAEERAGPSRDRVLVSDTFPDQERQGVAVADDEFPFQGLRPLVEEKRHEQACSGPAIGSSVSSPKPDSRITGRS